MKKPVQVVPPREPVVAPDGTANRVWTYFFQQLRQIANSAATSSILTTGDERSVLEGSIPLAGAPGEIATSLGTDAFTIGLADAGDTHGAVGDASHVVALTIDAKGRVIHAAAFALNTDNIAEGSTNLFFTVARARASLSATAPITYNPAAGLIASSGYTGTVSPGTLTVQNGIIQSATSATPVAGYTGTKSPVNSITVSNGIVTAVS